MLIDAAYLKLLDNLLFKISLALPPGAKVVVAGGAIRDMLLEKEIADIDVFIEDDVEKNIKLHMWFTKVELCEYGLYEDSSFNVLYKITDKDFPVPIQIIKVTGTVEEHIEKFPLSLSRVFYSEEKGLQNITPKFLKESLGQQVLFDKPVNYQYLDKMKQKFPNWMVSFAKPEYNPAHQHELEF